MNWVLFIFQALTFFAAVGRANLVESNRVENKCTDDFNLGRVESFSSQFSAKPAVVSSGRSRMGTVELSPTQEVREGVDVVWQIPANPKAVLLLVHSAGGTPFSYWPSHPNAPKCIGTPEHVVVTREALQRGFAVLAGTAIGREWQALWPPSSSVDVQNMKKILGAWRSEHGLQDLPLSTWGTSIGGDYVSCLAHEVKMHSLIVMISHGSAEAFKAAVAGEYPATLFVPMIKDEQTFSLVKENVAILRGKGIPSDIEEAPPQHVHPHFFAENIDELDEEQSARLHSLFVQHGIIAEDNSVKKILMKHEVEPYLRKAGILPTEDHFQDRQDEEKLEANKLPVEGAAKGAGGDRQLPGARYGGRGGPPGGGRGGGRGPTSERGEAAPAEERRRGRGPPSERGEAPPAEERRRGRGPTSEHGEAPPAEERRRGRGPPSERGEAPPAEERRRGRGPTSEHGEAPPAEEQRRGRGPPSERGEAPPAEERRRGRGPTSEHGEAPPAEEQRRGRGPPSERGEVPPAEERRRGRGLTSERGEAPPEEEQRRGRGPPSERGEAPPAGGRGGGRGERRGGTPPPSHPLADGVSNQLMVAQAKHTLTARHNSKVFSWLEGEGWPNVQPQ